MKRYLSKNTLLFLLAWMAILPNVFAQQKKPLDHSVYDLWNVIKEKAISNDGKWTMFSIGPEEGDRELLVKNADLQSEFKADRGEAALFSFDSKHAIFFIRALKDSVKQAKRDKRKPEQMPTDSLGIFDLKTGNLTKLARVKSFKLPKEAGGWLAVLHEKSLVKKDSAGVDTSTTKKAGSDTKNKKSKKKKAEGTTLVLLNLESGKQTNFEDVVEYVFADNGRWLIYTASNKDSTADGVFAVDVKTGRRHTLLAGKGDYKQPAINKTGQRAAFLANKEDIENKQPAYALYQWKAGTGNAKLIANAESPWLPTGWWVSEFGKVYFSESGSRLFFGTAPRPEPEPEEVPEDEKVNVDIWHWRDPYLQPMQLKQLEKEKKRTYLAVVHLPEQRFVQLATKNIPEVKVPNKGEADMAVGHSNLPYRQQISWDWPAYHDVYTVDVHTGKQRLAVEKLQTKAQISPQGKFLAWWSRADSAWFSLEIKSGKLHNLTSAIGVPFYYEKHDWPFQPDSYGSAGWTNNDRLFLVYDKYDIWACDPGIRKKPRNITAGLGRRKNLRFRYIKLNPEAEFIETKESLLLTALFYQTKAAGFFETTIDGKEKPTKLLMSAHAFSKPLKAKFGNRLLFTQSSFQQFPDYWSSDLKLNNRLRLTNANPQQGDYSWGTAELIEWFSTDGRLLQGILYKPENFRPGKKYPMLVYFYEKSSQNLHRHWWPRPHRSIINFIFYVSRGYLVFVPDIPYKIGYPGESAMNAVLPGVTELVKSGFVDRNNIGVQGHSWGGYQIAYMITRTNIFKAAEAGAPVSNMTSAYGGIRWGTGKSRMFQYERTQSRIGGSLWEYPLRYLENSPLFWLDKVETPLLIMHNDHDGHVPWYQGIELFVGLRRLGKQAWLINYNNEPHWPTKFQNRKDWQIRLQQYFDHFLKGEPAPVWLEQGVPAIKKGRTLGIEIGGSKK